MQTDQWLPLTEYALRSGMSISTLRRKIKSNTIDFRMEDGRYLIRSDDSEAVDAGMGFTSSDAPSPKVPESPRPVFPSAPTIPITAAPPAQQAIAKATPQVAPSDRLAIQEELRLIREESALRWRALEARVAGLAKRIDLFSEQMAEVKMLVKIFEEKLDERL